MPGVSRAVCARLRAGLRGFFFWEKEGCVTGSPWPPSCWDPPVSNQGTHETRQVVAVTPDSPSQHGGTSRVMFSLLPVALMLSALLEVKPRSWLWDFCYYNLSRANPSREVWQAGCGQENAISAQRTRVVAMAAKFWLTSSGECWVLAATFLSSWYRSL